MTENWLLYSDLHGKEQRDEKCTEKCFFICGI